MPLDEAFAHNLSRSQSTIHSINGKQACSYVLPHAWANWSGRVIVLLAFIPPQRAVMVISIGQWAFGVGAEFDQCLQYGRKEIQMKKNKQNIILKE
jgi:hypothetical protein